MSFNDSFRKKSIYEKYGKRIIDCVFSGIALLLFSPLMLIIAVLVRINLGKHVLFIQERPGLNGRIFKLVKFKSMLDPQTKTGRILTDTERTILITNGEDVLSDEERLTRFGRILRSTSLDELPELWNIFVGDMSLVGPRPLSTAYLPYYNEFEKHRHDVRPGLTGAAQVHGRNSASWESRFKYDVEYTQNLSLINDIKIIIKTIVVVLKRGDIGQGRDMPESFHVVRQLEWQQDKNNKNNKNNKNK